MRDPPNLRRSKSTK